MPKVKTITFARQREEYPFERTKGIKFKT